MQNTKFSIIIPVYNVEEYLKECIDSIKNQSFQDFEVICINDGSTDNSLEILNEYAKNDNRFKVITQENQGQGIARNNGLDAASGEYILFIDPDDWIENNALEFLYKKFQETKAEIIQFDYISYNHFSKKRKKISFAKYMKHKGFKRNFSKIPYYSRFDLKQNCLTFCSYSIWNKVYSLNFIRQNNIRFAPNKHAEDHIFSLGCLLTVDKIYYYPEHLYIYRCRPGSAVNTYSDDNFCVIDNVILLKKFLNEHNLFDSLKKNFSEYSTKLLYRHYKKILPDSCKEYKQEVEKTLNNDDYKKFLKLIKSGGNNLTTWIFSIKNKYINAVKHKLITILGFEICIRSK